MENSPLPRVRYEWQILPLELIAVRAGMNCRFIDADVAELAASIAEMGLLFPPLVVPAEDADANAEAMRYYVVHGHRRLAALRSLKWESAPFFIGEGLTITDQFILNITENGRENLTPAEFAERCSALMDLRGRGSSGDLTTERLAQRTGYSVQYVQNMIRVRRKLAPELWEIMVAMKHKAPVGVFIALAPREWDDQVSMWNGIYPKNKVGSEQGAPPPRVSWRDRAKTLINEASQRHSPEFVNGAQWLYDELSARRAERPSTDDQ